MPVKGVLRICKNGHRFYKSSDCPVCPVCENERKPDGGLFSAVVAPARRALENAGIHSPNQLARFTEKEILTLHGMGPASIPLLKKILKETGYSFRKPDAHCEQGNLFL